ncbi:hypothetical protein BO85DRAFT_523314 [Aspergillus piperis CBS 112811]|uniref:Uncharacterized protein n=1 Tax=Aspergillus piperis CBS 112811 TaxID=1448313 RepID=A0A8G1QWT9_9EURO|nr:hypothetical protein BO85DRAFT_523314 [Aspergillus piperis CBS 112811]RAH53625.1 hypothetical protein BO85DRAFT_523314 [Aspergillus piperis CBS 112811]
MKIPSNLTWFDNDGYIGLKLAFPAGSTWQLERKIKESEDLYTQETSELYKFTSQAQATFVAYKVAGNGPSTAAIKIHMQIPCWETVTKQPSVRAKQADPGIPYRGSSEVAALSILTKARCSSAPYLINWTYRRQNGSGWVPGGYIHFIAMELLPGVNVSSIFNSMERRERDHLRSAFKKAWIECMSCGVEHDDIGLQNLLWDREQHKCYLIDFEHFDTPSSKFVTWRDRNYLAWNLAQAPNFADFDDMSTWIL